MRIHNIACSFYCPFLLPSKTICVGKFACVKNLTYYNMEKIHVQHFINILFIFMLRVSLFTPGEVRKGVKNIYPPNLVTRRRTAKNTPIDAHIPLKPISSSLNRFNNLLVLTK